MLENDEYLPALTDASKPISSFRTEEEDGALRANYGTSDQATKQPMNRRRKADREQPRIELPLTTENVSYLPKEAKQGDMLYM